VVGILQLLGAGLFHILLSVTALYSQRPVEVPLHLGVFVPNLELLSVYHLQDFLKHDDPRNRALRRLLPLLGDARRPQDFPVPKIRPGPLRDGGHQTDVLFDRACDQHAHHFLGHPRLGL
jgi:hypothetical protein